MKNKSKYFLIFFIINIYLIVILSYQTCINGHLVLIRHGQSEWNSQNKFTGWVDIDLSDKGKKEAKTAGELNY